MINRNIQLLLTITTGSLKFPKAKTKTNKHKKNNKKINKVQDIISQGNLLSRSKTYLLEHVKKIEKLTFKCNCFIITF